MTGGSSGIGLAIAKQLAAAGANVWILARRPEQLSQALVEIDACRLSSDQKTGSIAADVSNSQEISTAIQQFVETQGAPDFVFNSAGVAHPGTFEDMDLQIFRWTMDINFFGTVNVCKACLPAMKARGSGHIINISSIAGFVGLYGYTAYGASKYAVRGFTDALRSELKPLGIKTSIVFPPDTRTPQLTYENQYKPEVTKKLDELNKPMTPDDVARNILKDTARGKYIITPGPDSRMFYTLIGFTGNLVYHIMDFLVARAIK